jgi:hypothetical protein
MIKEKTVWSVGYMDDDGYPDIPLKSYDTEEEEARAVKEQMEAKTGREHFVTKMTEIRNC